MNILSFIISIYLVGIAPHQNNREQEIILMDKKLNEIIVKHLVKEADAVYSDNFVLTTGSGASKNKQTMLSEIGLPDLIFEINETTNVQVRLLDNTAVLTGTLHQKGVYKQKPFDNKLSVTDTWVFTNGAWKLLAGHASLIK